ncbi:uncharacterized protein LOC127106581 [Lathyrus oleraceus]|uniref:uncharacterized protein LOC127106581 n=1 Tax=Pisum sativum TaxID=3888 RepID=UPI0021D1242F|nr:uncharacterized protein LOC127106581 [Pisum sativum]
MVVANAANVVNNNDIDHYSAKPPIFDGEKFDYWKDRIESLFLGYDVDLWDLVVDGYDHPVNTEGNNLARSVMSNQQKKDFKNHHKKQASGKEVICLECKEPGHYKNDCPKLKKDRRPKNNFSKTKKGLMATWDDSESKGEDSDEEKTNVALMATTEDRISSEEPYDKVSSESKSDSDSEEVFSNLSRYDIEICLSKILEKYQSLESKFKDLKQVQVTASETQKELEKDISSLN